MLGIRFEGRFEPARWRALRLILAGLCAAASVTACVDGSLVHKLVAIPDDDADGASMPDSARPEAGMGDARADLDAGDRDAAPDAMLPDATAPDATAPDATAPDASPREASVVEAAAEDGAVAEATVEAEATPEALVEVGIPDAETGIQFTYIDDGDTIPIQMGGQGGTHARIALQVRGFGNRVFFQVFLRDLDGDGEVATLPLSRARPIACDDNDVCRISPLFVLLGGLAPPEEWDGLNVEVTAVVSNADGLEAQGSVQGVLHWFEP